MFRSTLHIINPIIILTLKSLILIFFKYRTTLNGNDTQAPDHASRQQCLIDIDTTNHNESPLIDNKTKITHLV